MKGFPVDLGDCHHRCIDELMYSIGESTGRICYCIICKAALGRREFFKSAGCATYLSLKVGQDKLLEKDYHEPYGLYYYC